jgi:hypothetical protein
VYRKPFDINDRTAGTSSWMGRRGFLSISLPSVAASLPGGLRKWLLSAVTAASRQRIEIARLLAIQLTAHGVVQL